MEAGKVARHGRSTGAQAQRYVFPVIARLLPDRTPHAQTQRLVELFHQHVVGRRPPCTGTPEAQLQGEVSRLGHAYFHLQARAQELRLPFVALSGELIAFFSEPGVSARQLIELCGEPFEEVDGGRSAHLPCEVLPGLKLELEVLDPAIELLYLLVELLGR